MTHDDPLEQGQQNATYTITVTNDGAGQTDGEVIVGVTLPDGLASPRMSGEGWDCPGGTLACTRSDKLGAGQQYQPIELTVDVAAEAPPELTVTVTVSGGGSLDPYTTTDLTHITQFPNLVISKSHDGDFVQGQTAAVYSVTVSNTGTGWTTG